MKRIFITLTVLCLSSPVFCQLFDDINKDSSGSIRNGRRGWLVGARTGYLHTTVGVFNAYSTYDHFTNPDYTGMTSRSTFPVTSAGASANGFFFQLAALRRSGKLVYGPSFSRHHLASDIKVSTSLSTLRYEADIYTLAFHLKSISTLRPNLFLGMGVKAGYPVNIQTTFEKKLTGQVNAGAELGLMIGLNDRLRLEINAEVEVFAYRYNNPDHTTAPVYDTYSYQSTIQTFNFKDFNQRQQIQVMLETSLGLVYMFGNRR